MAMHTQEELEQARAILERRSPKALAAFILTLSHEPNGVGDYVHTFVAADEPNVAADLVRTHIATLREGERDYDHRHRRGAAFTSRADLVLEAIEGIVLPASPAAAFDLIVSFIESDREFADNSYDDDLGLAGLFDRVCAIFLTAAKSLPPHRVQTVLKRLTTNDNYGLRSRLTVDS